MTTQANFIPVTLKRMGPGFYRTTDGKFDVYSARAEESNGYRKAGEVYWMWSRTGTDATETHEAKWQAKQALEEFLWAEKYNPLD